MKIVILVVAVIILISGGIGLGYWLQSQHVFDTDKQTSQPTPTPSSGTAASPTPTPSSSLTACASSQLKVTVSAEAGGGAAGSVYYAVTLTDSSTTACTLTGYPGVSLLNEAGQQVGQPADRSETDTPTTVTLQPGQQTKATLRVVQNNFDPGVCKDGATTLKVFPPNSTVALTTPTTITTWCPGFTVGSVKPPLVD
jgi:hypothetical protein